jgi:hypothetical protein
MARIANKDEEGDGERALESVAAMILRRKQLLRRLASHYY